MRFETAITLKELAARTGCRAVGNPGLLVTGLNEIHRVEVGDATFCDHPKYYAKALASKATVVIIDNEVAVPAGKALLVCDRPFDVFTELSRQLRNLQPASETISATARVGEGTVLMPGVFVGRNVTIGKHCFIHPNVTISDGTVMGDRVTVHAGTVIGSDAFYYKRREVYEKLHSCGHVQIDDDVEIGACCTIDRGVSSVTRIGSGTKIDNMVHIGHDTVVGRNCLFAAQVGIAGVVTVEDDVILWGQVGVQKDLTIGQGAVVLGQSGIGKSLKGGITYFGSPVREAREKMKELALIKQLPEIVQKLRH
ncbi:MAG: UDP-3-O-(3-hydroxymyristoyl)glucosamine N-acyltransferase [Flavobacteriales bacterium]|nr:UDP-3-O-(3-hydroxymyristoyl)glucosamine N-acyltransferase [Flavobacteriales bacterium]